MACISNLARRALLEIVGTVTPTTTISVGARDRAGSEIDEFHGKSAIGRIPGGAARRGFHPVPASFPSCVLVSDPR